MNILHFLPVYLPAWHFGGPIFSVSRVCEALAKSSNSVRVLTTTFGNPSVSSPDLKHFISRNINDVEVIYYRHDHPSFPISSKALISDLAEHINWASLVHLSSVWHPLGFHVQATCHRLNKPYIQSPRGALSRYSFFQKPWKKVPYYILRERPMLQHAAAIHCTSENEKDEIRLHQLRPPIHIIPNPIEFVPSSSSSESPELDFLRQFDCPILLVAGRLHHKKGLNILPTALQLVRDLPWHLVIAGDASDSSGDNLISSLNHYQLHDRFTKLPTLSPSLLRQLYSLTDILLMPSRHENFGNVLPEALFHGARAIVSPNVAASNFLSEFETLSILPRSPNLWSHELRRLLGEKHYRTTHNQQLSRIFSPLSVSTKMLRLYNSILSA